LAMGLAIFPQLTSAAVPACIANVAWNGTGSPVCPSGHSTYNGTYNPSNSCGSTYCVTCCQNSQEQAIAQQQGMFTPLPAPNAVSHTPYQIPGQYVVGTLTQATLPGSSINSSITNSAVTIPGSQINSPITNSAATIPGSQINSAITNSAVTVPGANIRGALFTGSAGSGGTTGAATVTGAQVTSTVASANTASSIACSNSGGSVTATVYLGGVGVNSWGSGSAAVPSQLHTVAYGGTLCPGQYSVSASCGPGFNTSWNCGGSSCGWSINLTGYSGNIISNSYGHSGCQYNHANGYGYQNVCQNTSNFSMWTETNTLDTHSSPGGLGNVNWNLQDNVSGGVNNGTACTVTATLITQYPY
jgi:hypothetical protein